MIDLSADIFGKPLIEESTKADVVDDKDKEVEVTSVDEQVPLQTQSKDKDIASTSVSVEETRTTTQEKTTTVQNTQLNFTSTPTLVTTSINEVTVSRSGVVIDDIHNLLVLKELFVETPWHSNVNSRKKHHDYEWSTIPSYFYLMLNYGYEINLTIMRKPTPHA